MIVSEIAGTTRDAIDFAMTFEGRPFMLVDTAGLRRAAKVGESVEYYTSLRSRQAAERADVALVVCDATEGITSQDLRVAELAMQTGCATAIVLNKWDLVGEREGSSTVVGPDDLDQERARVNAQAQAAPARADSVGDDRSPRRASAGGGCRTRRSQSHADPDPAAEQVHGGGRGRPAAAGGHARRPTSA